jgi:F-type H+-transporting ATPase subunit b
MHSISLCAAGGHDPPLIDIDATLFIQLGIFLVLFVVLRKFVFLPYLEAKKDRAANIDGAREKANRLQSDAAEKLDRYERRLTDARKEAAAGRSKERAEGEAKAAEVLASARQKAEGRLSEARTKINKSVPAAELALRTRADELARAIASKVLGRAV